MKKFEAGWPASFHAPIQKRVQTMARLDKHQKVDEDFAATETLYAKAMALQGRSSNLDIKSLMKYEPASHPT
jgi:hypothetical protein